MLGIFRSDGFIEEGPAKIQGMLSDIFQNIFSPYPLTDVVVASKKDFYKVVPNKVLVVEHDRLD